MKLGKLLVVDLASEEIERVDLPQRVARQYLGGRGINAWFLAQHMDPQADPLGPENILLFSCGLLTGTGPFLIAPARRRALAADRPAGQLERGRLLWGRTARCRGADAACSRAAPSGR